VFPSVRGSEDTYELDWPNLIDWDQKDAIFMFLIETLGRLWLSDGYSSQRKFPMTLINHIAILDAEPEMVWHLLRQFGSIDSWHAQITSCVIEGGNVSGDGGSIRTLHMAEGEVLHERLLSIDNNEMTMTYGLCDSGVALESYSATLSVRPAEDGHRTLFTWQASFEAEDDSTAARYESLIGEFILAGLDGLGEHLGVGVDLDAYA